MSKYGQTMANTLQGINEKLKPSDGAGAYVKDFRKSDAPQFKGKSDKEIQKMAIAAYLDDKEENMKIGDNESVNENKVFVVRYTDPQSKKRFAIPFKTQKSADDHADQLRQNFKGYGQKVVKSIEVTKDILKRGVKFKEQYEELDEEVTAVYTDKKTRKVMSLKFKDKKSANDFFRVNRIAAGQINFREEDMQEDNIQEDGHTDVASAIRQCKTMIEDATQIASKLQGMNPEESLPSWWTNKLAVSSNSMNKLRDYFLVPTTEETELDEATMVSDISGISIPALKREAKKKNIKVSRVTPGGPMGAEYEVTFTGSERDLMRYAKEHLGFEGRNFKDLQKHLNMGEGFASDAQRRAAFAQGYKAKGKKGKKEEKTKFERYTGVPNPRTEGRKSNYATDDEDEEGANKNIIMQLYKAISLRGRHDVVFDDGKKVKVKEPIAIRAVELHRQIQKPRERLAFQNKISKSYRDLLNAIR